MFEQRGRREQSYSRFRDTHRADRGEFLLDDAREPHWQTAAVPSLRPLRHSPSRVGELVSPRHQRHLRIPISREPGAYVRAHLLFADLAHRLHSPTLHQQLPMITRLTEEHLGAFRALEPQLRIVVPAEADTAVNLNAFRR